MKSFFLTIFLLTVTAGAYAQVKTENDGDWNAQSVILKMTPEAGFMIRTGDIDNLGFGWSEGFNPFTGRSTEAHEFPWEPKAEDAAGTDRIMIGSFFGKKDPPCGGDGYSSSAGKPAAITLPLDALKDATIRDAALILFIDDFQAPSFCSKFQISLNGKRFPEMERQLNSIDQTGPIGKVIMMKLTTEMLDLLRENKLTVFIDDPVTGSADGYAIDFVKLLVNLRKFQYYGNVRGLIIDDEDGKGIDNAVIRIAEFGETRSFNGGNFTLNNIPAGLAVVTGEAPGYASAAVTVDVITGETSEEILIKLRRSKTVEFTGKSFREGESVVMKNIQFAQGSSILDASANAELDLVAGFLKQNPDVEIELSGHTSSEGSAESNRLLSLRRVQSCKSYLSGKGIDDGRITNVGYGPDKPIATNDTEEGRALNRRVEMRITKL